MTEYVVTRWYRAPELLLNSESYTPAIDMWSVGCIIAEMLGRKPIFPGRDYVDQLRLIVQILGVPSDEDMEYIKSDQAKDFIRLSMQGRQVWTESLNQVLKWRAICVGIWAHNQVCIVSLHLFFTMTPH